MKTIIYSLFIIITLTTPTFCQVSFLELGQELNIVDLDDSRGVAIVDLDEDAISEIIISNKWGADKLYKMLDTVYVELGELYGLTQNSEQHHNICLTDIDKDRRPDLFMTGDPAYTNHGHLFINHGYPPLVDRAIEYNLYQVEEMGSSFFQFTPTSELAVLCGGKFMVRDGDEFIDITEGSGLESIDFVHVALHFDIDGDYDDDLFIVGNWEAYGARMYRNNGDTTWTDISTNTDLGGFDFGQGAIFGDIDNDGDFDVYITSGYGTNSMWENDGTGFFSDITTQSNTGVGGYSRGACFGDFDNDCDLDIFVNRASDLNVLFLNNGTGVFTDYGEDAGMIQEGNGMGCATSDLNNDGHLDIVASNTDDRNFLYMNQNQDNSFLKIRMIGDYPNYMALGAIVELYGITDDLIDTVLIGKRQVSSSTSMYSVNDPIVHFGTGEYHQLQIHATFNSLYTVDATNIAPGQTIIATEHTTSIDDSTPILPKKESIINAYPNPVNNTVRITAQDEFMSDYDIEIFDVLGRLRISDKIRSNDAGQIEYTWFGTDKSGSVVPSGVYIIKISGNRFTASKKLTLLK